MTVQPGETFQVETELTSGQWLQLISATIPTPESAAIPSSTLLPVRFISTGPNPVTALVVHIEAIDLAESDTRNRRKAKTLSLNWIRDDRMGRSVSGGADRRWVSYIGPTGSGFRSRPMIGVSRGGPRDRGDFQRRQWRAWRQSDIQEMTAGNTRLLPVRVEAAMPPHVGDVHAVQGDGELCCAGGIETRSVLTLRVELIAPNLHAMTWPRIETAGSPPRYRLRATAGRRLPESRSRRLVLYWMEADYGFTQPEALMLLGQVAEARGDAVRQSRSSPTCAN